MCPDRSSERSKDEATVNRQEPADEGIGFETLRNAENFRRVLQDGTRSSQGGIVMVGSPGPSQRARLGLIVSRRCGNAVRRNRIKRRLRHAAGALRLQPGNDYVIIASGRVAEVPYPDLREWLRRAVEELDGV